MQRLFKRKLYNGIIPLSEVATTTRTAVRVTRTAVLVLLIQ